MQIYEENEEKMDDDSIDLLAMAQDMWRNFCYYKKRLIFLILVVAVLFTSFKVVTYSPVYKSYITFVVTKNENYGYTVNSLTKSTIDSVVTNLMESTFPYIMDNGGLNSQIREEMGINEDDIFPVGFSTDVTEDLNLLTINAISSDAKMAQKAIDAVEKYYPSFAYEIESGCEMAVIDKSSLSGELVAGRSLVKNMILGIMGGCFIVLVILGIMSIKAPTIRNYNDLKKYLNISCLGIIP